MLLPCLAGVFPMPGAPCAPALGTAPKPGQQKPTEPGADCRPNCPAAPGPGAAGNPGSGDEKAGEQGQQGDRGGPALMGGFLSRIWRFTADADSYDASTNTLNVTVTKIVNLTKRFKAQDDNIVDKDADVVFTKNTKVYDADGKRLRTENGYDAALDAADSVAVTGKIAPQAKWNKDQDGTPVTTVRAKRVKITG